MRWPLRWQLLAPIAALLSAAVVVNAVYAAWSATVRHETQTAARLAQVASVLGAANFPLTPSVLERLQKLTGAHAAVWNDAEQRVTAATIPSADAVLLFERPRSSSIVHAAGQPYRVLQVPSLGPNRSETLMLLYPQQDLTREQRNAAWPALLVGLATIGVVLPLIDVLSRRFARRIDRVQQKVAAVATGDFTPLLEAGADDELRALSRGVNEMSARLAELQARIERDERARLLAQFTGGLAHHFRNAIAGARLALEIHRRRCSTADGDESVEVALRQLLLVEQQIRGVLTLGRKTPFERAECDVLAVTRTAIELLRPTVQHAQVQFDSVLPEEPVIAVVDRDGVQAALSNLLLNAVEAAGPQGRVTCTFHADPERLTWEIIDNGPGPPADVAASLGVPFVTGKADGVGLGLAFARQLAEDHGGMLDWSRAKNATCFRWQIPR
ncbi:MAG TPA: HAMP domain-containing sensor histidine kinase [Planctomycetaceae bacterium]|nr:HAMP domain-containing sensor histidine kinase [Planctomycetaceae bacterium]